jgi:hypothetical protein
MALVSGWFEYCHPNVGQSDFVCRRGLACFIMDSRCALFAIASIDTRCEAEMKTCFLYARKRAFWLALIVLAFNDALAQSQQPTPADRVSQSQAAPVDAAQSANQDQQAATGGQQTQPEKPKTADLAHSGIVVRSVKSSREDFLSHLTVTMTGENKPTGFINISSGLMLVNGQILSKGEQVEWSPSDPGFIAYGLSGGTSCLAATKITPEFEISTYKKLPTIITDDSIVRNNITIKEVKSVDPQFLRLKLYQAAQALASVTPWNGTAITNQYGAVQGNTNTTTFVAGQLMTAGAPQVQTTYNTGQPSTVQTTYNGQCPPNYYVSGITAGNGITCAAIAGVPTSTPSTANVTSNQTTSPTPYLQNQISAPAFSAALPSAPTSPGALSPSSPIAQNPYDALSQQVELNSQLLTYQALFTGLASDNSHISSSGTVGAVRHQVTLAFPISVTPFAPYKGAVAEVRIFMFPSKASVKAQDSIGVPLSVVNLLPASNTYNVAKATTDTKQFGAGVTLDLIGLSGTAGKTKSALYLAKDTDTIALQYENPLSKVGQDVKKPIGGSFRNLLPVGECDATSTSRWGSYAKAPEDKEAYSAPDAIIFGWQFKPVLGNEDIQPINRLFFAQIALDDQRDAPVVFVETRWRAYNRKTGVVGQVYKNSCTWKSLGPALSLQYASPVTYLTTDDMGGGNVRVTVNGFFTDPNVQVRLGGVQRAPDSIANDLSSFEFITSASSLVIAPNFEIISEGAVPQPLVPLPAPDSSCELDGDSIDAYATPYSDGTALISVDLNYDDDRDAASELPLVLFGSDIYGLRDHPFLPRPPNELIDPQHRALRFTAKMDALAANPMVAVKDVNWSQEPISIPIRIGPTFSNIEPLSKPVPDNQAPASLKKGIYRMNGTGFRNICQPSGDKTFSCLALANPDTGAIEKLDSDHLEVLNDGSARIRLDKQSTLPLLVIWQDENGDSEWPISTKPVPPVSKNITADKSLKKNDSQSVVFSGKDFTGVTAVSFEDTNLAVLAKDNKSITVLVTTKVTATIGAKALVATGADGKPTILPLTVVGQ